MKTVDSEFQCPITLMLRLASAKWTVEILRECSIRPTRTRQFLARIPGLSMKCLQERLKDLEANGMIDRVEYDENVKRVEHSVTDRGKRLLSILLDLKSLAEETAGRQCCCPMESFVDEKDESEMDCPRRRDEQDPRRSHFWS